MRHILHTIRKLLRFDSGHSLRLQGAVLAVLVLCGLGVLLLLHQPPETQRSSYAPPEAAPRKEAAVDTQACPPPEIRQKVSRDVVQFEEALGSPLEEKARMVDHAILEGLILAGLDPSLLRIEDVGPAPQPGPPGGAELHFQRIVVRMETPPPAFLEFLVEELARLHCQARLEQLDGATWAVSLMQRPTHEIVFRADAGPPAGPEAAEPDLGPGGRDAEHGLVIVMDDLGQDLRFARELAVLPVKVSFSVLPRLERAAEVAAIAAEHGRELLLHQPMEPMDGATSPGPGALFVGTPPSRVRQLVRENLARVPGAVGLNNHMGSRFTQDAAGVDAVLQVAADQGIFVIDSVTHPGSVLAERARALGVPVLKRDVFLDVVRDTGAILYQLRKAERMAGTRGDAVAIGHPHPETLEALRIWSSEREARGSAVPVVTARTLVGSAAASLASQTSRPGPRSTGNAPLAQNGNSR